MRDEKEKKIMVTLTSSESKRLIAKYISKMPIVVEAMERGIVNLQMSSTNGYVYEELSGSQIDKSSYVCGFISGAGGCAAYLPAFNKRECYFEKGVERHLNFPLDDFDRLFKRMGVKDIIIKSGNLLDRNGEVCVFVGEPSGDGGEWGKAYEYVKQNGIQVIVPMTLNKTVNVTVEQVTKLVNVHEMDWEKTHVIADAVLLPGVVVTEIDAIEKLCGAKSLPVAMNGVSTGEGTVTLCIYGNGDAVDRAWELVTSVKGEPQLDVEPRCGQCLALRNKGLCVAQQRVFTRG